MLQKSLCRGLCMSICGESITIPDRMTLITNSDQGLLVPTVPDDTTVALSTIIDHLPPSCATMFTQAEMVCPFCQAKRNGIVPTFSCSISWKENGWVNLKTALEQAQPFLGHLPKGWHHEGCDRDDQCPKVTKLGKWLYGVEAVSHLEE